MRSESICAFIAAAPLPLNQYSLGKSNVLTLRSASVIIHIFSSSLIR